VPLDRELGFIRYATFDQSEKAAMLAAVIWIKEARF
jgi:hypothetical protein